MAPRTRNTKVLKENILIVKKTDAKSDGKIRKPPRKALVDKTNSLSDDNASIDVPIKTSKAVLKNKAAKTKDAVRPRRDRRLPTRYVENQVLNNLSNSKKTGGNQVCVISITDSSPMKSPSRVEESKQPTSYVEVKQTVNRPKRNCRLQSVKELPTTEKPETSKQSLSITSSPFKTPSQSFNSSLVANKPKRICRLPSKFDDHTVSPNRFIPVQPCFASTPIIQKKAKTQINVKSNATKAVPEKRKTRKNTEIVKKNDKNTKNIEFYFTKSRTKGSTTADTSSNSKDKTSSDTNNNPKAKRTLPKRVISTKSPNKAVSPKKYSKSNFTKRLLENNLSFRVFEDRNSQDKDQDVYEFTYDPNEEPTPKKKRKKVVKKRPPKQKTVVLKNNYDINVQKALDSLKSKVKPSQTLNIQPQTQAETKTQSTQSQNTQPQTHTQVTQPQNVQVCKNYAEKIKVIEDVIIKPATDNKLLNYTPALPVNESAKSIHMSNYASFHVEDIAADFETDNNDMNYSPVNSPCRPKTPVIQEKIMPADSLIAVNNNDPLNLQGEVSFFDDQPVASSSMNVSTHHPQASPWRVDFGNLPIRWQANTYVKPNMTPAVDSSFITSEEITKKKHVYTNMVAEEPLPEIEDPPGLKQTSIISFMREVAEKSLKKKRGRSMSPKKANSLFEDFSNTSYENKTPKKARKEKVLDTPNASNSSNDRSCERDSNHKENHENSAENHNEISAESIITSDKSPIKKSDNGKDGTFFGFDESEDYDQENVSPVKKRHTRARGLRSKSRAVLQEINVLTGPTRAVLPVTSKSKLASSEVVEKLYDQLKSGDDAPQFPDKEKVGDDTVAINDEPVSDDDESVHLFEDIEVVHHLKPQRKSYGKAKKVTFQQASNSDSDTQIQLPEARSSDEDDLGDLTFQMPNVKQKKITKKKKAKKQLSKKEEKEVEEWAAGFNSMCEDIDEFPLVLE